MGVSSGLLDWFPTGERPAGLIPNSWGKKKLLKAEELTSKGGRNHKPPPFETNRRSVSLMGRDAHSDASVTDQITTEKSSIMNSPGADVSLFVVNRSGVNHFNEKKGIFGSCCATDPRGLEVAKGNAVRMSRSSGKGPAGKSGA